MNAFEELAEAQRAMKQRIQDEGETILKSYFNDLFAELPDLETVGWTQYIPGFNDGDPCVFSIGSIAYQIKGVKSKYASDDDDDEEYDDADYYGFEDNPKYVDSYDLYDKIVWIDKEPENINADEFVQKNQWRENSWALYTKVHPYYARLMKLESDLNENETILQYAFGDNAKVIVSREDILVEEYECGY